MKDFKTLVQQRRSHRKFTEQEVSATDVQLILRAALMSPTAKNLRAWRFAVVDNKADIVKMADAKEGGAAFLAGAPLAIVVLGNPDEDECWIEDGSIATVSMQYQAEELGLGSCWVQMRGRGLSDGTSANDIIHGILSLPEELQVLCVLAIGHPADERPMQNEDRLKWENVIIKD